MSAKVFILDLIKRLVIIVSLIVLLRTLSERSVFLNYNSNPVISGTTDVMDLRNNEEFDNFIYYESLEKRLEKFSDNNTVGRIKINSLNINCPVENVQSFDSVNNIDYWGLQNGYGIIRTKSTKDTFLHGVTFIEGNNYNNKMFALLKMYQNQKFCENNRIIILEDINGNIKPFILFSVSNMTTKDLEEKSVTEVFDILRTESIFQLEAPMKVSNIIVIAVHTIIDENDEVLLIGGYYE